VEPLRADGSFFPLFWVAILVWRLISWLSRDRGSSSAPHTLVVPAGGHLEMRLRLDPATGDRKFDVFHIEAKGAFPIAVAMRLSLTASILDVTEKEPDGYAGRQPVLCLAEQLQEPKSICYQDHRDLGEMNPGAYMPDWTEVSNLVPEALVAPTSGLRKFAVFLNLHPTGDSVVIDRGFVVKGEPLVTLSKEFEWDVKHEGYKARWSRQQKAEAGCLRLALAVACSGGALSPAQSERVQVWLDRRVASEDEAARPRRRAALEKTRTEAFSQAEAGTLSVGDELQELKAHQFPDANEVAVELALDLVVADGTPNPDRLRTVRKVAGQLEVDPENYRQMEENRLLTLTIGSNGTQDLQALLGVDPEWPSEQVRQHLTQLYTRWNARAEAARDAEQRQQAERMLERIALARQEAMH